MEKGESQNGCFMFTCTYQGVRNIRFAKKFRVLYFLETPVLRFVLLPYYRRKVKLLWSYLYVLQASIRIKPSVLYGCSTQLTFLGRIDLNPSPFLGESCSEQSRSWEKSVPTLRRWV